MKRKIFCICLIISLSFSMCFTSNAGIINWVTGLFGLQKKKSALEEALDIEAVIKDSEKYTTTKDKTESVDTMNDQMIDDLQTMFDGLGSGIKVSEDGVNTDNYVKDTIKNKTKAAVEDTVNSLIPGGNLINTAKKAKKLTEDVDTISKEIKKDETTIKETKSAKTNKSTKEKSSTKVNENTSKVNEIKVYQVVTDSKNKEDKISNAVEAATINVDSLLEPTPERRQAFIDKYNNEGAYPIDFCLTCGKYTINYGQPKQCSCEGEYFNPTNYEYCVEGYDQDGELRFRFNYKKFKQHKANSWQEHEAPPNSFCTTCGYIWWGKVDDNLHCDCNSFVDRHLYDTFKEKDKLEKHLDDDNCLRLIYVPD